MKHKVFAYVTRMVDGNRQILAYSHRNHPEAGIQIPGGTVEPGEREQETLYREIEEESGLVHLKYIGKLDKAIQSNKPKKEVRHFYLVESYESPPDSWTHTVQSFGKDDGHIFDFFWINLREAEKVLADDLGKFLNLITSNYPDEDPANATAQDDATTSAGQSASDSPPFIGSESQSRRAQ